MFDAAQAHEQLSRWSVMDAYTEEPWMGGYQCFLGGSWEDARLAIAEERSAINAAGGDLAQAHRARLEEEETPGWVNDGYAYLDCGVIGLVCALSAAGVCTVASGSSPQGRLHVSLIADLRRLRALDQVVQEVLGCRAMAGGGLVVVVGDSYDALSRLAQRLLSDQASFDGCERPRTPGALDENNDLVEDDPQNQLPLYPSWDSQLSLFPN